MTIIFTSLALVKPDGKSPAPDFTQIQSQWVDSILKTLTLEQKIAQLIMYPVYSNRDEAHFAQIENLIKTYQIGGVIYMQGGPVRQVNLNNRLQAASKIPLLTSIDGEWGLAMRLDSVIKFPRQMLLGAIQHDSLIYEMGKEIARHCQLTGVHINFAPVVDINVNPRNPVINSRSFGENKVNVANKAIAYMEGLQKNGVLACAKHFPGHGDTDKDSHFSLPSVNHSRARIDSVELYPYKRLIEKGLGSVMVAHLFIPSLDDKKNRASSLSPKIVQKMLKDSLKFKGLAITDALNMEGVNKYYSPGEADLAALLAGNDIMLFSQDISKAILTIKKAVEKKKISEAEITNRCRKVLQAKKWLKLDQYQPLPTENLTSKINSRNADVINRRLVENAMTVLNNDKDILPIKGLNKLNIASVSIGVEKTSTFQTELSKYTKVTHFVLPKEPTPEQSAALLEKLKNFNLVIIGVHGSVNPPKNFGFTETAMDFVKKVNAEKKTIVSLFANPYALGKMEGVEKINGLVVAYEENKITNEYAAQLIFGGIEAKGKLPVSCGKYPEGSGLYTAKSRLKYGAPEEEGFNYKGLQKVDSIALDGIKKKAYPGCQVLVAKNGNVVYWKSFGYHRYDTLQPVKDTDLYDLASVTKVTASVPGLMKLMEMKKLTLDDRLCYHLPYVDSTKYENMNLRDMLAHTAGLVPTIMYYTYTQHKGKLDTKLYDYQASAEFPYQVANELFIHKSIKDSIRKWTLEYPLREKREYKYSDVGYYFYKDIIEMYFGNSLDKVLDSLYYAPLGATTLTYKPLEKFSLDEITPTENDRTFRKRQVHGYVHDQGASMIDGVGGHAGLFSNANDLAKMFQMYVNFGHYGGEHYLTDTVIKEFIKCQFCEENNRRGAGFDRPASVGVGPTCNCVSYQSFGHTGFTGTMAWADPDENLVYIFLSNRVYPDAENKKIIEMGIRTKIQQAIYDSLNLPFDDNES